MADKEKNKQADEATRLLADTTRFQIYREVVMSDEAGITSGEIAEKFGLHRNVARMHLEKLSRAGLLKSVTRKPPGGGRPAREYHVGATVTSQYPPRDYQLLADVTVTAIEEDKDPRKVARKIGRDIGNKKLKEVGIEPGKATAKQLIDNFVSITEERGMYASIKQIDENTLQIRVLNCVFKELSSGHAGLVCGLHAEILRGICETHFDKINLQQGSMEMAKGGLNCQFTVKYRL